MKAEVLLLGAGHRRGLFGRPANAEPEYNLTTVDINRASNPDVACNLNDTQWPLPSETYDEVHAYEVLEHLGRQGDAESFFATFNEIWRVLKHGGHLVATVPAWDSLWAWGDPSHTRVINEGSLTFLCEEEYVKQIGSTPMSDFRGYLRCNFEVAAMKKEGNTFFFALRKLPRLVRRDYKPAEAEFLGIL